MNEFKGPWEYRVDPIRAEWLTGVQARAAIDAWMNRTEETGTPTFTMSRRPRQVTRSTPTALYLARPCDTCGHAFSRHLNEHFNDTGCTVRHCVCGAFEPVSPRTVAQYLADDCDTCGHTLNWHRNDTGCTVRRCVCGTFEPVS